MKTGFAVLTWLFLLSLCSIPLSARAFNADLSPAGKAFIKDAASAGLAEVQLGQLAQDKGSAQQVKDFGVRMVLDHSKVNEDLKAIAAQRNLKLPGEVERKHTLMIAMLTELSGDGFDRKYMQAMIEHHQKSIARFKKAIKKLKDQDLKAWAVSTLPVLQQHLQLAKDVARGLALR